MNAIYEKLVGIMIVVIIVVVLSVIITASFNPLNLVKENTKKIIGQPITIFYENIPCMINCLTSLQGEEISMMSYKPFLSVGKSSILIEWFPCNQEIMKLAYFVSELSRWNYTDGEFVRTKNQGYDNVKNILYKCITDPSHNYKCYSKKMSFSNFCKLDTYLKSYNFLPCSSDNSFVDFLDKSYFRFANRDGDDIKNGFVCSNDEYQLCKPDKKEHYDFNKCWPSWMTLISQETKEDGSRNYSLGRCEDFALLYYSLFRAIDTPAKDMKLKLGICNLPCPCEQVIKDYEKKYNMNVIQYSCYVPANLSIKGYEDIDACNGINSAPSYFEGKFIITGSNDTHDFYWVVSQNFTNKGAPAYKNITLDNNYSDDISFIKINNEIYSSSNKLTSDFLLNKDICLADISKDIIGKTARFGFEINVKNLNDCVNNSVILNIGFLNSKKSNYYILTQGKRGVVYNGIITGKPYFKFTDMNGKNITTNYYAPENKESNCKINYEIEKNTAGVIINDICDSYYTNDPIDMCNSFIIDGRIIKKGEFNSEVPSRNIYDLIK